MYLASFFLLWKGTQREFMLYEFPLSFSCRREGQRKPTALTSERSIYYDCLLSDYNKEMIPLK